MDKRNGVHTCNGILFNLKKDWNSNTCCSMDEPWGQCAKWNESIAKDKHHMIPLISGTRSSQIHRDRKRNGGCQGLGGEERGLVFNGCKVSVWEDEKVLEMDGGVGWCWTWLFQHVQRKADWKAPRREEYALFWKWIVIPSLSTFGSSFLSCDCVLSFFRFACTHWGRTRASLVWDP